MNNFQAKIHHQVIPGDGKTVLNATILEEITKRVCLGSAMAFYFFDYKDSATHDAGNVLGTLTKQIASQEQQCYENVETLYQKNYQDGETMRLYTIEDIKQCLVDMMKTLDHAYIVVDALDDCITDRSSVLELLHDLNDFENDSVKTIFTGRD